MMQEKTAKSASDLFVFLLTGFKIVIKDLHSRLTWQVLQKAHRISEPLLSNERVFRHEAG